VRTTNDADADADAQNDEDNGDEESKRSTDLLADLTEQNQGMSSGSDGSVDSSQEDDGVLEDKDGEDTIAPPPLEYPADSDENLETQSESFDPNPPTMPPVSVQPAGGGVEEPQVKVFELPDALFKKVASPSGGNNHNDADFEDEYDGGDADDDADDDQFFN